MQALMQLGGLVLLVGMTYAPVVALLGLLNRRDRRQSALFAAVLKQLAGRELRGRLTIQVRCGLVSRRSVVLLDMRACSRDETWDAFARLFRTLPPSARLVVDGTLDPRFPAPVTLATASPRSLSDPSPLSATAE